MRLTVDVILRAQISINPLKHRELNLRGYKAPAIENLGVTKDGFDCLDLSDNEVKKLENFPRLRRLRMLLLNNNHISKIHENLAESIENLEYLILTGNHLAQFPEIGHLVALKKLDTLSLLGNPVTKRKYYREYVIHTLPQLRVLDFQKIKPREREAAAVFFHSVAGKRVEQELISGTIEFNGVAAALPPPAPPATVVHAVTPPPPPPPPSRSPAVAAAVPQPKSHVIAPAPPPPTQKVQPPPAPAAAAQPVPAAPVSPVKTTPPQAAATSTDVDMDAANSPVTKKKTTARATAATPSKLATPSKQPVQDVEMKQVPFTPSKPIEQQTVTQLREALKERGLSTKGLKAELVKRLKEAVGSA